MPPSMIACATCTPRGPNSLARPAYASEPHGCRFPTERGMAALLTLGDGPLRELARGKVGKLDAPAERRRRACDEERGRVGRLVDGGE